MGLKALIDEAEVIADAERGSGGGGFVTNGCSRYFSKGLQGDKCALGAAEAKAARPHLLHSLLGLLAGLFFASREKYYRYYNFF